MAGSKSGCCERQRSSGLDSTHWRTSRTILRGGCRWAGSTSGSCLPTTEQKWHRIVTTNLLLPAVNQVSIVLLAGNNGYTLYTVDPH